MDFRVIGDTYRYGVRVTAIVVRDGKLLTYKVEDQNHLVGGAILVGEASRKAVAREVKEELGVDCEVEELMFVVENRFNYKGELHHMIEFNYKVTLLAEVPSHTLDEGNYKWGVTTSQAYFPKDNTAEFDNDLTITDWLTQYSEIKDATYVRGFLGRMLFPGEDGIKRVRVLSGGEKVRCLLSKMMISGANILILDEPTNHLDMESITALNNGLIKFPGVILFTSHDHQFVQTTANRIMEILPNGTMIDKITTYDEYLASDEMAKKRHVFEINEEDASDN